MSHLGLYVHMPWCVRKCPYCDFNSHGVGAGAVIPEEAYLKALVCDLEQALPSVWGRSVSSIFFGGGTPNLISPQGIGELLSGIRSRMRVLPTCEVTLEANPGAAQKGQFQALRAAGVTRLSLGVQTFSAAHLNRLGRIHDPQQALDAARAATEIFDRVNIDLMYGLPDQTLEQAILDVDTALTLGIGHLSLYQLTLEPNTEFFRNPPTLPHEELIGDMQDALIARLVGSGLQRYEVSAYAKVGEQCAHNLNYWTFGDYLGIGAGAHSKLRLPERGTLRQWCLRAPSQYMDAVAHGTGAHRQTEAVRDEDLGFEFMMNALRLVEGIEPGRYAEQTGRPLEDLLGGVSRAQALGLMAQSDGLWRPTPRGLDLLSDLQLLFMHQKKAKSPKVVHIKAQ